ncbi:MAG: glycosyltransferase [Nitrospirae bacterium]|nr:glycosyltransferase [Nitrospirota bacterium]
MATGVLYITCFGGFAGGGQRSLYLLVKHIDKSRFKPVVAVPETGDLSRALEALGVRTVVMPFPRIRGIAGILRYRRRADMLAGLIKDEGVQIVHTDSVRETFYAASACRATGARLVWHIRDDLPGAPLPRLMVRVADRLLVPRCDTVVLASAAMGARFGAGSSAKFRVVHNGVELEGFGGPRSGALRSELGIGPDVFVVAEVAAITPRKGQDLLIRAAAHVKEAGVPMHVVLAGQDDGGHVETLRALADGLGMTESVHFLGDREDVPEILGGSDALALPSRREAMPRSVIEAMAAGLPVVASDAGGAREAVVEGVTGYIVPCDDYRALADRLMRLAANPELRSGMGERGRQRAMEMFDVAVKTREIEAIYEGLL